jgi:Tol biopolymer transport system component
MSTVNIFPRVHIGEVVRNAVLFNPENSGGRALNSDMLIETVARFFSLLRECEIEHVLVGGIALLQYVAGRNTRITNDLDDYGSMSLTTDSGALVTTRARKSSNIWIVPNGDASQARQLTSRSEALEGSAGVAWTPDGSIVYSSKASGGVYSNIWIMNADGSNPSQLTDAPANDWFPAVSPDGRYIVFSSNRSGEFNLWRMDMNGGNLKQLTNGLAYAPEFSPDGRWVACMFGSQENMCIWKFPVDGSSPVQLTETNASVPTFSWDGKLVAYDSYGEQADMKPKVVIVPSEGGARVKALDYTPFWNTGLNWSPDDRSIIYVDLRQGGANLWRLPLDGGPAQQLTDFKSEQIFNFKFTHDGRQLVCARGTTTSDVVMISESK